MRRRIILVLTLSTVVAVGSSADDRVDYKKPICRSVRFADETNGWIAGYKGVFHTSDGGETWTRQATSVGSLEGPEPTSADIDNGAILWANHNMALIRRDGGLTVGGAALGNWRFIPIPTDKLIYVKSMAFANEQTGWAVGVFGAVFRTRDGGVTWEARSRPSTSLLNGLFVSSSAEMWAVGEKGLVIHTRDGGQTWEQEEIGADDLWHVRFKNSKEGWSCGIGGRVFHTTDGRRWERQNTPVSGGGSFLASVSFADANEGWAVGSKLVEGPHPDVNEPLILHTADGGLRWELQAVDNKPFAIRDRLLDVQALPSGRAWAIGEDGTVLRTVDHGKHWLQVKLPS